MNREQEAGSRFSVQKLFSCCCGNLQALVFVLAFKTYQGFIIRFSEMETASLPAAYKATGKRL
jgi:hypothetical protein